MQATFQGRYFAVRQHGSFATRQSWTAGQLETKFFKGQDVFVDQVLFWRQPALFFLVDHSLPFSPSTSVRVC